MSTLFFRGGGGGGLTLLMEFVVAVLVSSLFQFSQGPVFGIREALLFSDFEGRKKGLLWNFLKTVFGQLR